VLLDSNQRRLRPVCPLGSEAVIGDRPLPANSGRLRQCSSWPTLDSYSTLQSHQSKLLHSHRSLVQ